MEIIVAVEELNRALSLTQNTAEKKTTMPILMNVLLSASEGRLTVGSSDMEVTTMVSIPAKVKSPGSTTAPAKMFAELVRELPDGEVAIKVNEGERIAVVAQRTNLKVIGASADEYPPLPGMALVPEGRIVAQDLALMIDRTIYAVSLDEGRYTLNGVCLEGATEKDAETGKMIDVLRMVATDGHRLAVITRPSPGFAFSGRVIIPRKGLQELRKFLAGAEDSEVRLGIQEGFLLVEVGDAKISTRLIDGEFPDYREVLPKDKGVRAEVALEAFAQALRRVALVVTDKAKCVRFDFTQGQMRLSSVSAEIGEAVDELPVTYTGKSFGIGFNAKYIQDVAQTIQDNGSMILEMHGEDGPGIFFPASDEASFAIVMPVRIE